MVSTFLDTSLPDCKPTFGRSLCTCGTPLSSNAHFQQVRNCSVFFACSYAFSDCTILQENAATCWLRLSAVVSQTAVARC
jgi:hypothetical protein